MIPIGKGPTNFVELERLDPVGIVPLIPTSIPTYDSTFSHFKLRYS